MSNLSPRILRTVCLVVALTMVASACSASIDDQASDGTDTEEVSDIDSSANADDSESSEDPNDETDPDDSNADDQLDPDPGEDSSDADSDSADPTPSPEPTAGSGFVTTECAFDIPPDAVVDCGTLAVPENYDDPTGVQIELAVAVLRSPNPQSSTPTIYLEGGPGGHAVETIPFVYTERYLTLLEHSDVIVVDQRGAGLSTPRLDCPDLTTTYRDLGNEPDLSADEARARVLEGLGNCSARLTSLDIDITQYNTENNANDIDLIRQAYGSDQLDLFGISYGTRLGLAVMRLHPESVRSAVLDSTLPPEVDATADSQASLVRSYERVMAACEADTACSDQFGDLDARFHALYDQLEADPLPAESTNLLSGETFDTTIDGETLIEITFGALYDPYSFTDLPELVADLEAGNVAVAESYLDLDETNSDFFTIGMFISIECNEEVSFSSLAAVAAVQISDPLWATALASSENVGSFAFEVCDVWGAGSAPAAENEPVTGDVPTLFLAGEFDPVTPPEWANDAAAVLSNARVVTFPTLSHGVTGDECGMSIAAAFIVNPDTLDISCVDDVAPITFVGAATTSVEIEPYTVDIEDFASRVTSVRPAEWTPDVTGIQATRGVSVIDETILLQVGGSAELAVQFASFVGDNLGLVAAEGEPVDIGGRTWQHFSGTSTQGITLDVWAEQASGLVPIVLMIATESEHDTMFTLVAEPALDAIQVEPL